MDFYARSLEKFELIKSNLEENVLLILLYHEIKLGLKNHLQRAWIVITLFFGLL